MLEIGPGIGPLTVELASRAGKVVALELDQSLRPILAETLRDKPNVEVRFQDVSKTDCAALVNDAFPGLTPHRLRQPAPTTSPLRSSPSCWNAVCFAPSL